MIVYFISCYVLVNCFFSIACIHGYASLRNISLFSIVFDEFVYLSVQV